MASSSCCVCCGCGISSDGAGVCCGGSIDVALPMGYGICTDSGVFMPWDVAGVSSGPTGCIGSMGGVSAEEPIGLFCGARLAS